MTVVNPKSISGINSITTGSGSDNLLTIHTNNGTERVRVNSDGDVIVGSGITVSPDGDMFATGVTTSTTFVGALTGNVTGNISGGTVAGSTGTFTDNVDIATSIRHIGDTDTKITFDTDIIHLDTANVERVRITSAGLVGIATAAPRAQFDVIKATGNVIALFEGSNASQNHRVRIDASGASSTSALSISNSNSNNQTSMYHSGGNNNMVIMGGQTAGAEPTAGTAVATFASGGDVTVNTGNLVIGTSGKGIDFSVTGNSSGTMSNELFDDYEEGSWQPQIGGNNMTVNHAHYTKIGNFVHLDFDITGTASANGNTITGLPFTAIEYSAFHFGWVSDSSGGSQNTTALQGGLLSSSGFTMRTAGGNVNMNVANGQRVIGSAQYRAA